MLEELSRVLVYIVALLAGKVVAVDECLSRAGCVVTGFESCSISVVVSCSERGGGVSQIMLGNLETWPFL